VDPINWEKVEAYYPKMEVEVANEIPRAFSVVYFATVSRRA